jgi:hypothetical protein
MKGSECRNGGSRLTVWKAEVVEDSLGAHVHKVGRSV